MRHGHLSRRGFLTGSVAACLLPWRLRAAERDSAQDVPWLADVQDSLVELPMDAPKLKPLLIDENGRAITTLEGWQRRQDAIRRWWLDFLGPLRVERGRPPTFEVVAEDHPDGVVRQLVRYEVEPGLPVEAYLLKPARIQGSCPGVVALHSTVRHTIRQPAGVEGKPEKAFGLKMARRGYVAICPRCFLWSNDLSVSYQQHVEQFRGRHPNSKGMAKMLYDAMVAVDILEALPEVDPKRLCAVGHSLGAKQVLYLAAFDKRIRATVSSEGGVGTRFSNWEAPWYLGRTIRGDSFDHEHHELLGLIAPRPFLLLGGDSADGDRSWPFIEAALPVYRLYGGTPRLGLFNHRKGHSVPPEAERRIYEWLETYC
jgi:dienelactone hydrolase